MIPPMTSHDWRRGFAFIAVWGGCVTSFIYICVLTWMLRHDRNALFHLCMVANVHLFFGMLALGWFGGRRLQLEASRDRVKINDQESAPSPAPTSRGMPYPDFTGEDRS